MKLDLTTHCALCGEKLPHYWYVNTRGKHCETPKFDEGSGPPRVLMCQCKEKCGMAAFDSIREAPEQAKADGAGERR